MWKFLFNGKRPVRLFAGRGLLDSILKLILFIQEKCSEWLNKKSKKWSPWQTKIYLMIFCLSFVVISAVMLWAPFTWKHQKDILCIDKMPMLPAIPDEQKVTLTQKDLNAIATFRSYLDSLQTTPDGRLKYDQLAKARPGLIDSLATIQHFLLP